MRKIVDKTIRPMTTVTNLSPGLAVANIHAGNLGTLPIGYFRGAPAFWDLDRAVVQPLVNAEKQHIMGILAGRLANYDMLTVTNGIADAVGVVMRGRLTVPANDVWFVHAVTVDAIKDATAGYTFSWRTSLWPDVVATGGTPDVDGQGYFAAPVVGAANTVVANISLFGAAVVAPAAADTVTVSRMALPTLLRLPGGTTITLQTTVNTAPTTAATPVILRVFGYVGKALVS